MFRNLRRIALLVFSWSLLFAAAPGWAQSSGTLEGAVKDPSGAAVAGATVEITYAVSGYRRETTTGSAGEFRFTNVPFNPYHLAVTAAGFASYTQDVEVRSSVPTTVAVSLKIGSAETSITVEAQGADLVETDPTFHTDVDRALFDKLPLESQSSSVSSLVTLATPGVVADSNGLFHGLGDHAENSFSVDGQPITDQQSKVFSNQIPAESIQSMEVVSGAPPAEFGDKTSLIIKVTTRSGLGQSKPTGSVKASYGSFGSVNGGFDVAFGGAKWGNFIAASALSTSRFLDPPELQAIHDKGNQENLFDRVDYQLSGADTVHVNLGYTRSWFQTPNTFDNLNAGLTDLQNNPVGQTDQRSLIKTFNIAPTWTRLVSATTLLTVGAFVRQDQYGYFPSGNVFADQPATVAQQRKLTNAGLHADVSYVKGMHNIKAGATFEHTFLTEIFNFGITSPLTNPVCLNADGSADTNPTPTDPAQCTGALQPNPNFVAALGCIDLSRPAPAAADNCPGGQSALFPFRGHTDIKQLGLYVQDTITKGNWAFNLGIRGDVYRGIVHDTQAEPRLGVAYNVKKTKTVLRASYARVMETPFNENLILASQGASNPVITDVIGGQSLPAPIRSGQRNQFNAGFQQAFGKFLVVDADYLWKYTHNGYDFSAFGNTPIYFPIAWHNSKVDGVSVRVSVPNYHGLTAFTILGHVRARYFPPQVGGLGATVAGGEVFRIDHDQAFQQTTHVQYQPWKSLPWVAMNWRYDSGLVASNPNLVDFPTALGFLDADQQAAIGLYCGNQVATLTNPLTAAGCAGQTNFGAKLLNFPAPGTGNVDRNPTRVTPRNLFDASVGDDDLFHGDRYKWSLRFTVINLTNKTTLFNFLSTFSGTHFVAPRAYTAELGFHF
ncbi:MAG: TonB-dependent receptor [Acidobacteriia bacterium]|nr:TonB-dependent receptor [Terriglobia bacterium]